jgi:quinol monooxygenase YgiN
MITFTARLKAMAGKEKEAEEGFKAMAAAVAAEEPGALAYICHGTANAGEYLFFEVYADQAAKDTHMATPHFKKLMALMGPVLDASCGAKIEDLDRVAGFAR